jgi:hypothetical protein
MIDYLTGVEEAKTRKKEIDRKRKPKVAGHAAC